MGFMTETEKNNYVPLRLAKEYFAVTDATIRGWLRNGCPYLKLKSHHRVKIAEVEAWLRGQNVQDKQ
jgi:hypothetical protein